MAQVLLADALSVRDVDARVHSAGLLDDGRAASEHGVTLMADRGLDLSAHRSRRMTAAMLGAADLIIGMERRHVREAAVLEPSCWPRAFTLPELARRAQAAGPRPAGTALDAWLPTLVEGRTTADHLGSDPRDEVADPYGRSLRTYRRCAEQLDQLVAEVVDGLWPAEPPLDPSEPTPTLRSTSA